MNTMPDRGKVLFYSGKDNRGLRYFCRQILIYPWSKRCKTQNSD